MKQQTKTIEQINAEIRATLEIEADKYAQKAVKRWRKAMMKCG